MKIPIQNLYYLLCYAWDKLEERDLVAVSATDQTSLLELLTQVLVKGSSRLFKQGMVHTYEPEQVTLPTIRGKLLFTESLQKNEFRYGRAMCEIDQYTPNHAVHQILKSTFRRLLKLKTSPFQSSVRHLYTRMHGIDEIALSDRIFRQTPLPRTQLPYRFLLNVCELIHKNLLVDEATGQYQFQDFWRDEKQMAGLFEAFVRNFYRYELPQWRVRREIIHWQLKANETDQTLLPLMQTDLTLERDDRKIIIDTKYYADTFQRRFEARKIHSPHLYQLFAYLNNQPASATGILLYPTVTESVSATFTDESHQIRVHTLNLNQHWTGIRQELIDLIQD